MEETKLTANLPNLDVQILHRALPEENAEAITIQLRATPSFEAVAPMLPLMLAWTAPMQMWAGLVQQAWAPWLAAIGAPKRLESRSR